MLNFVEDAQLTGTRITNDGYLVASVLCARTGIQDYLGSELDRPDMGVVRVLRPESSVFSKDSLATFSGKPTTDNHPPELVTADNWKDYAVGSIGEEVLRDGEYIRVPITLMDKDIVQKVQDGKREISMGYTMNLAFDAGTTPDGESYDAIMTDLKMNHLAVVDKGRAGTKARIGDNQPWGISPLTTNDGNKPMTVQTQTVVIDSISIETTVQGAQAIEKLQGEKSALDATIKTNNATHVTAIEAKTTELATKDAEIAELKKQVLSDADKDALVQARADLVATASLLAKDTDFKGMADADIKKTAVIAVRGEDFVKDQDETYINVSFDILAKDLDSNKPDHFRNDVKNKSQATIDSTNGQAAYEKRLNDSWKQTQTEANH